MNFVPTTSFIALYGTVSMFDEHPANFVVGQFIAPISDLFYDHYNTSLSRIALDLLYFGHALFISKGKEEQVTHNLDRRWFKYERMDSN